MAAQIRCKRRIDDRLDIWDFQTNDEIIQDRLSRARFERKKDPRTLQPAPVETSSSIYNIWKSFSDVDAHKFLWTRGRCAIFEVQRGLCTNYTKQNREYGEREWKLTVFRSLHHIGMFITHLSCSVSEKYIFLIKFNLILTFRKNVTYCVTNTK